MSRRDWPIEVGSQDDKEGLMRSVKQIQEEVPKLKAQGIPPSKIVLGGFLQGGAVALLAACRHMVKKPLQDAQV
jgi:predicted esterase